MRDKILNTPWPFMRWLRLGVGLYALTNIFFVEFNIFFLLFGLFFIYQALFNVGCGGQACFTPPSPPSNSDAENIEYQEIK